MNRYHSMQATNEERDAAHLREAIETAAALRTALADVLAASQSVVCGVAQRPIDGITTGRPLMKALQRAYDLLEQSGGAK